MDSGTRRDYRNVNSAIIVPRLNISLEDLIICICPAMLGNGIASILSCVCEEIGVFIITTGLCGSVALYVFARGKRREEMRQKGFSRSGVLRRYLAYLLGAEWLRCR